MKTLTFTTGSVPRPYITLVRHAHTDLRTGSTRNCENFIQKMSREDRETVHRLTYENAEINRHARPVANILHITLEEATRADWFAALTLKAVPWT